MEQIKASKQPTTIWAIYASALLMLAALIDSQVVAAIAPVIADGLGTSKSSVAATISIYSLAAALVALALARYGQKLTSYRWLIISAVIFSLANLIAASAPNIYFLSISRGMAGFAGGLISALTIAGLANASTYAERGKKMSIIAICYFLAPVLGVPLGTFFAGKYGWRAMFILSTGIVFCAGLLTTIFPLNFDHSEDKKPDEPKGSSISLKELAFRSRATRYTLISAGFISGGLVGFTSYLGSWLTDAFHVGSNAISGIYALAGTFAVLGGALGGIFADRFGKRYIALLSSGLLVPLILFAPTFTWGINLFIILSLLSFVAALRIAPLQALITELVATSERATFIAMRNGASQLGISLAVVISSRIYAGGAMASIGLFCALVSLIAFYTLKPLPEPDESKASIKKISFTRRVVSAVITLILLFFVGLPIVLTVFITKARTRPDEIIRTDTPANQNVAYEDVNFISSDGEKLSGWYLAAHQKQITIVMTHGLFRSRYEMLARGIDFYRQGYDVLLYDLRRHGKSSGEFSTIGWKERNDVIAATSFARQHAPQNRLVLMGVSMGAAATLMAAPDIPDVSAIIAESSYLSFPDVVRHHINLLGIPSFPLGDLIIWSIGVRMNFFPGDADVAAAVKKISCPIFFIGAEKDRRMPTDTVLKPLFNAANNTQKELYVVPEAGHGHAYATASTEYRNRVIAFLDRAGIDGVSKR